MWSHREILGVLPHRHPMLLVDAVVAIEPGRSITATKCVTRDEACYARASGEAAYPCSLILESFGQAAALLWLSGGAPADGVLIFAVAKDCVFEGEVFPGEVMEHRATLEKAAADSAVFSGEVWVDDRRVVRVGWVIAAVKSRAVLGLTTSP